MAENQTQKKSKRTRNWCFTLNNYTDEEITKLRELAEKSKYIIFGKERGEQGTPHLQGFVSFINVVSFESVKKFLPPRTHIEPARGTPEEAATYCKKDEDFEEIGEIPMTQKRKGELGKEHYEQIITLAKKGKFEEIDPKAFLQYYRTIRSIHSDFGDMPPDLEQTDNFWYYGNTGTGKSFKARTDYPGAYLKMCNKWWDNYQGQETVIIEDFDKKHDMLGYFLKIWGDRYAFPAEIKGSKVNLRPKRIIVTSNYSPDDIWGSDPSTLEPIKRRFRTMHFPDLNRSNRYLSP